MAPGFEGRAALAWPLCSTGLEDEALGAFLLNFDLHGQPHPQGLWERQQEALQAGMSPGFYLRQKSWPEG